MLTKIILLNSAKYEQGIITIDDVESIQIVGRNNLGKTTLISVLNFLYLPSQKDWNFDHSPKETLNFYFKKLDKNYILFEIYKDSYFCILMKRGLNNDLEYYKIDSSYDDIKDKIIENSRLLKFDDIQTNLLGNIAKLESKKYKALLYGHSKRDKTILWLKENKQTVFSKIYRYLLDITQIDNVAVKESLLVADNREKIKREFTNTDSDNIQSMQKQQRVIERLKNIKQSFGDFKNIFNEFSAKTEIISDAYIDFWRLYDSEKKALGDIIKSAQKKIENIQVEEINPLEKQRDGLNTKQGELNLDIKNHKSDIDKKLATKVKIESYDDISLLTATQSNLNTQIDTKKYQLDYIKHEEHTLSKVEHLISQIELEKQNLSKQIENYDNLLIHHISENPSTKRIINSVLSKDVLNLDKENILNTVSSIKNGVLKLFDGEIDTSSIEVVDFITLESLREKLLEIDRTINKYLEIRVNIQNFNNIKTEIKNLEREVTSISKQIEEIESLPLLVEELTRLEQKKSDLDEEFAKITFSLETNKSDLDQVKALVIKEGLKEQNAKERLGKINVYFMNFSEELESIENIESMEVFDKNIDELAENILNLKKELQKLKEDKNRRFSDLKHILQKEHALESDFIKEVEEEIDTIIDKEGTISELIQNITNEISSPTKTFLRELEDFEKYIVSVNTAFKKYKVSNIETIEIKLVKNKKIIHNLKQIADISKDDLFDFDQENQESYEEQIRILKEYISKSKVFRLSDLFDVAFVINGKEANLSKQIESTGTDKILKIMLFILIIKNIIIQDEDNRLVVYVDELSAVDDDNSAELIRICKENNLIPIFASPDKKMHVQKYYDLQELSNGQIVVDENRAILWQK